MSVLRFALVYSSEIVIEPRQHGAGDIGRRKRVARFEQEVCFPAWTRSKQREERPLVCFPWAVEIVTPVQHQGGDSHPWRIGRGIILGKRSVPQTCALQHGRVYSRLDGAQDD